ncbi:hypothetical protein CEP52_017673 [Fusarium oligoseptatum]|uniref:Uncharacterized protein n=1 Tax=Fusarium oligoseptatum TaxID=2604345 RepID=A0A428RK73_9HYPO|nr:hypothetical protein CEP52_017673 [Fusarium oligoseptatum]
MAMTCVPTYIEPEKVKAALEELEALGSLTSHQWADGSYFFLDRDGRFRHTMRDERSWQVRIFLTTVSIQSLFSRSDRLIPREDLRLTVARHGLLIAILVHSLLWTRDGVVDAFGKGIALEHRWVLSPDAIVQLMDKVRGTNRRYRYEQVRDILEKVPVVSLDKDVSNWISIKILRKRTYY